MWSRQDGEVGAGGLGGEEGGRAGAWCTQGGRGEMGGWKRGEIGSQFRGEEGKRRYRRSGARERPPFLEPRGRLLRTPVRGEGELQGPGRRGGGESPAAALRPPTSLTCSAPAPRPHCAPRPAPLAARPPVARTPGKHPAPGARAERRRPAGKAPSPPPAPQLPCGRARSPPRPQAPSPRRPG